MELMVCEILTSAFRSRAMRPTSVGLVGQLRDSPSLTVLRMSDDPVLPEYTCPMEDGETVP